MDIDKLKKRMLRDIDYIPVRQHKTEIINGNKYVSNTMTDAYLLIEQQQAEIDECRALLEEVRDAEYLYGKLHGTVMPKVDALLSKHKGE